MELSRRLAADDDAPRAARALMEELGAPIAKLDEERRQDLEVVLSELVSNAVVHGAGSEVSVSFALSTRTLRIEVADDGTEPFDSSAARPRPGEGGWGLKVVDAFTDRWGIELRPHTVAWCEVDLS
jgi:anti-sigma regulatory factor (Ser/Thr protein kinase)